MEQITWRPIEGYEGRYDVNNKGQIRSRDVYVNCRNGKQRLYKGRIKPIRANNRGYLTVALCKDNNTTNYLVHRLVAEAFIPNTQNKPQVNHIDGDVTNNQADNLEWVTDNENKAHSSIAVGGTQRPKKKVLVREIETGNEQVFEGLRIAERTLHLDHKSALNVLKGRQHKTKGYVLTYVQQEVMPNADIDNTSTK